MPCDTRWAIEPLADDTFDLSALFERDGEMLAEPRVVFRDDVEIRIGKEEADVGSFRGLSVYLRVSASPAARPRPPAGD
jgi:hypothetical protein